MYSTYCPDDCKPAAEREAFFEELGETINTIHSNEYLVIAGDFNMHIESHIIPEIKQQFNKVILNDSGEIMMTLCLNNELRINNTFCNQQEQYRYRENYRGQNQQLTT